jgi:hypothetical protein
MLSGGVIDWVVSFFLIVLLMVIKPLQKLTYSQRDSLTAAMIEQIAPPIDAIINIISFVFSNNGIL